MTDAGYVIGGYGIVFVTLAGYTIRLLVRGRSLSKQVPPEDRRREQRNGPGRQPRSGYAKDRNHPSQKKSRPNGRKTLLQGRVPTLASMPVPKTRDRVTE